MTPFEKIFALAPEAHDPARKGQLATPKVLFGDGARYAIYAIHTRWDGIEWHVADAERGEPGQPEIIRQADSRWRAMDGLFEELKPAPAWLFTGQKPTAAKPQPVAKPRPTREAAEITF